mmetsp:Transcript_16573/g.21944  ORF Transcript_16573/g.21944 Transcript_16573/m.21944 type:complete len:92 (-) Transcript_16573:573-848(-)
MFFALCNFSQSVDSIHSINFYSQNRSFLKSSTMNKQKIVKQSTYCAARQGLHLRTVHEARRTKQRICKEHCKDFDKHPKLVHASLWETLGN